MEKEKKGLFGRLLDFWREKIGMEEPDSIGFWNDTKTAENHLAEMGAVASLTQEETRKTFWAETAETSETERPLQEEPAEQNQKQNGSKLFVAEIFRNGERETEEIKEAGLGKAFAWETPAEEKVERSIIPAAEEVEQGKENAVETLKEFQREEMPKREEKLKEPQIDIEKLMRQMTKKLWEERESCGRRLR